MNIEEFDEGLSSSKSNKPFIIDDGQNHIDDIINAIFNLKNGSKSIIQANISMIDYVKKELLIAGCAHHQGKRFSLGSSYIDLVPIGDAICGMGYGSFHDQEKGIYAAIVEANNMNQLEIAKGISSLRAANFYSRSVIVMI